MARLGDVFTLIRNGASIKQTEGAGGIPITRIETISNRDINRNKLGYAGISDIKKYDDYILQDNDILMSHINSEKHLGKAAIYHKENNEKIIHGMNLLMLRANKAAVLPQYAIYYFETPLFQQQIVPITKKSVNQASFTVTALKDLEIPLPELSRQEYIAFIFDKLNNLIFLRKQQLAKLDELVKARFVEMFGDPETNNFSWDTQILANNLEIISGYAFKSDDFKNEGIPVLRIGNINSGHFLPVNMVFWQNDSTLDRYKAYPGDLVISLTGTVGKDDYGNVCILGNEYPQYYLNQRNARLVITPALNKHYLAELLRFPPVKSRLTRINRGVRQANISNKDILDLEIPIPPAENQIRFSDFVEKADESKLTIQQSLAKLEILKKALMQEYFG